MEYTEKMISVIVPVYNSKDYLLNCMNSILNQTYRNFEVVLIDDGSIDGSGQLCENYVQTYHNISCIHQINRGVSSARNRGIDTAKGEYILFVDSDDYIEEEYLEKAILEFKSESVDMYLCGYQNVRKNGKIKEKKYYPLSYNTVLRCDRISNLMMRLFNSSTLHAIGTKIYKRTIIEKYRIRFKEEWSYYEDIYFCLNYLKYSNSISIQNKIMYFYQKDICNSLSKQKVNYTYKNIFETYRLLYNLINHNGNKEFFCKSYLEQIYLCIDSKILIEKGYTINIQRLYKNVSLDLLYKMALVYALKLELLEYECIKLDFFWGAYAIRKYLIRIRNMYNEGKNE